MTAVPVMSQVKIGVEAGMTASRVVSGEKITESVANSAGAQVGLTIDYAFSKKWMLMSGLSFLQKGGEINRGLTTNAGYVDLFNAGPTVTHVSLKMNYLELPIKLGYKFRLGDKLDLIPSIGVYGSYGFNAGNCSLDVYHSNEVYGAYVPTQWKPFDGYYKVDDVNSNSAHVTPLNKLSHWDFGGVVGVKAVISDRFTASFNYSRSIRAIQRQIDLRNSSFQLSVGYQF